MLKDTTTCLSSATDKHMHPITFLWCVNEIGEGGIACNDGGDFSNMFQVGGFLC